jgi:hypothetical protein
MDQTNDLEPGWLNRQLEKAREDVKNWPSWMRREAGLEPIEDLKSQKLSASEHEQEDAS